MPSTSASAVSLRRIALSRLPHPRLPRSYALDIPGVFLEQRRALARCAFRAGFVERKSVNRRHPVYLLAAGSPHSVSLPFGYSSVRAIAAV